jgi:hypothetical protein
MPAKSSSNTTRALMTTVDRMRAECRSERDERDDERGAASSAAPRVMMSASALEFAEVA